MISFYSPNSLCTPKVRPSELMLFHFSSSMLYTSSLNSQIVVMIWFCSVCILHMDGAWKGASSWQEFVPILWSDEFSKWCLRYTFLIGNCWFNQGLNLLRCCSRHSRCLTKYPFPTKFEWLEKLRMFFISYLEYLPALLSIFNCISDYIAAVTSRLIPSILILLWLVS
jgi:hypothetical protein